MSLQVVRPEDSGTGFGEIGALSEAKDALREVVQLPLQHPELFASASLARLSKGVLLFGPPGIYLPEPFRTTRYTSMRAIKVCFMVDLTLEALQISKLPENQGFRTRKTCLSSCPPVSTATQLGLCQHLDW